jgi:Protein of unknown function (DUF3634)
LAFLFTLGLTAIVAYALWAVLQPQCAFIVQIKQGVPRVTRGTASRSFLHEIGETCRRHHVSHGVVRGVVNGRKITLKFGGTIPPACQQQLRNVWTMSGWSAGG